MEEAVNEEEAIAYVGLKIMFDKMLTQKKEQVEVNFNIANLFYEISGSLKPNKTDIEKLSDGIQGLVDAGVINLIDQNKGNYVLDIAGLKIENEAYTVMNREEIRTIFNLPCKQKFNLLRFAIGILGTIHSQHKCGFASFKVMSELTGISGISSCQKHFKRLEDAGIIYVRHSDQAKRDRNGTIKNLSNVYGRPCDKEAIDKFYGNRCAKQGHDFTITMSASRKAQLTRNYNKYLNNAYKGDVIELIKECLTFNKIAYNEAHADCQKDTSVFDPELIKKAEEGLQEHIKREKRIEKQKEKEKEKQENMWAIMLNPKVMKDINVRSKTWKEQQDYNHYNDSYYDYDDDPF